MTLCYHFIGCGRQAVVEKEGKSLCRDCSRFHRGQEYPLHTAAFSKKQRALEYEIESKGALQAIVGKFDQKAPK